MRFPNAIDKTPYYLTVKALFFFTFEIKFCYTVINPLV